MNKGQIAQIIRLVVAVAGSITGWAYLDEYVWAIVPALYAGMQSVRATKLINIKKRLKQNNPSWNSNKIKTEALKQLPGWIKYLPL